MSSPQVVIVGRPNVGKSCLLNWLAGRRIAIVDDKAGVTRDRVAHCLRGADARFFELIDTGGIGMDRRDDLTEHVEKQIERPRHGGRDPVRRRSRDGGMPWTRRSASGCGTSTSR